MVVFIWLYAKSEEYMSEMWGTPKNFLKQAGAELDQAQLKLELGFTVISLYWIDVTVTKQYLPLSIKYLPPSPKKTTLTNLLDIDIRPPNSPCINWYFHVLK